MIILKHLSLEDQKTIKQIAYESGLTVDELTVSYRNQNPVSPRPNVVNYVFQPDRNSMVQHITLKWGNPNNHRVGKPASIYLNIFNDEELIVEEIWAVDGFLHNSRNHAVINRSNKRHNKYYLYGFPIEEDQYARIQRDGIKFNIPVWVSFLYEIGILIEGDLEAYIKLSSIEGMTTRWIFQALNIKDDVIESNWLKIWKPFMLPSYAQNDVSVSVESIIAIVEADNFNKP